MTDAGEKSVSRASKTRRLRRLHFGVSFEQPLALWAAAVPAALLLAALFRPRQRELPVGSLLLWERALRRVGATRRPVEAVPLSLILCLVGVLLSALAWAGPRWD